LKPLFIWAGGKNKMLKKYADHLPEKFNKYIEPFFGGGAMFVWAQKKNPEAEFVINDVNAGIISIYREIKDNLEEFQGCLNHLEQQYLPLERGITDKKLEKELKKDWAKLYDLNPCRRYFYFKTRDEHAFNFEDWSSAQESATLYFLMKTGFNGIWQINNNTNRRFGTPFGLGTQKDKVYDRDVLLWWNKVLQNTTILSEDFESVVEKHASKNSYVFMDPPYRNSFTKYSTVFEDSDQERVISSLKHCEKVGAYGLLSNRDAGDGFFEQRWDNDKIEYFDVTYTAGRRKKTEDGFEAKRAREVLLLT
jgi:DNA adenine methylase